jgi:uncharacterized membrane protein (UPF0127 family)
MSRWVAIALLVAGTPLLAGDSAPIRFGRVITERGAELAVEIAGTPEQRARGYMFRERIGPEDGMLFLFEEEGIHPFWMKNTKIPLDIIWIGGDGVVVFVAAGVPPCTADPCPEVLPLGRARSVLELAAGRASELGLRPGTALQILVPPSAE